MIISKRRKQKRFKLKKIVLFVNYSGVKLELSVRRKKLVQNSKKRYEIT
jgi:hypothetical protein